MSRKFCKVTKTPSKMQYVSKLKSCSRLQNASRCSECPEFTKMVLRIEMNKEIRRETETMYD